MQPAARPGPNDRAAAPEQVRLEPWTSRRGSVGRHCDGLHGHDGQRGGRGLATVRVISQRAFDVGVLLASALSAVLLLP